MLSIQHEQRLDWGGGGGMSSIFIYLMSELNHIILTEQTTQTG